MKPLRTGVALAITVAVFYSLCALAWRLLPDLFMALMNNLFHGLNFTSLVQPQAFSWQGFLSALLVLSLWGLLIGMFFAWISDRLAPASLQR